MLSTRTGSVSTKAGAGELAAYYATEQTMASYYGRMGEVRPDLSPAMAERLGLDPTRPAYRTTGTNDPATTWATQAEVANLMQGRRADGQDIRGRTKRAGARTGFVDFTFSASKPLSVAIALATSPEERATLIGVHQAAVKNAMAYVEREMGHVRRGKNGRGGTEAAEIAHVSFDHFTSRPVGEGVIDPQTHTHVIAFTSSALTQSGHVGSLNLSRLKGFTKEAGAVYQAYVARGLRGHGVRVKLGKENGEVRLLDVSKRMTDAFSSRHKVSDKAARDQAAKDGLVWDKLPEAQQIARRRAAMMATRQGKQDQEPAEAEWRRRAAEAAPDVQHECVLGRHKQAERDVQDRRNKAYFVAEPLLAAEFGKHATLPLGKVREIAARGLVEAGIGDRPEDDIAAVLTDFQRGITMPNGQVTRVIIAGQSVTTQATHEQEQEAISLARKARRADRITAEIGAAGSGKSYRTERAAETWRADGRTVWGAALAWKRTGAFELAGIDENHRAAVTPFINRVKRGIYRVSRDDVVVVDEIAMVGTRQFGEILKLRDQYDFHLHMTGDDKQTRSVEAGAPVELLRRAGVALPEFTANYRQQTERDRRTASLWREGRALEALTRLQEDKSLHMEKGREATIAKAATLAGPDTLVIAASNQDARDVGLAIRQRRQAAGEIGPDRFMLRVTDRAGQFEMPIAVGDRVRLFDRVGDGRQVIGSNGDVMRVCNVDATGMDVQNERTAVEGRVTYDRLRDQDTGAMKLGTGECMTIHASQGDTVDRAVFVLPNGTTGLDSGRAYTASSRHRDKVQIVTNETAEREAIGRHQVGDRSRVTKDDVIKHMATNLGRQDKAEIATQLLERVEWQRQLERRAPAREASRGRDGHDIGV